MNRTIARALFCVAPLAATAFAQGAAPDRGGDAQTSAVKEVAAKVVKAEAAIQSLRMRMKTSGKLPGGLEVVTAGELRVLKETQPKGAVRRYSSLEYSFGEGVRGRLETAETAAGIQIFEEDPAFGAVFLQIEPLVVRDLEWAGTVLERSDLPGMVDPRASAPLGSSLLADVMQTFDLQVDERDARDGEAGVWVVGQRKAGLDEQNPDLPLADRVEFFVRGADSVVMVARYFAGTALLQQVVVERVEINVDMAAADFVVDSRDIQLRSVQDHAPMWEQIEKTLQRAEDKSAGDVVRPSRRAASDEKSPEAGGK